MTRIAYIIALGAYCSLSCSRPELTHSASELKNQPTGSVEENGADATASVNPAAPNCEDGTQRVGCKPDEAMDTIADASPENAEMSSPQEPEVEDLTPVAEEDVATNESDAGDVAAEIPEDVAAAPAAETPKGSVDMVLAANQMTVYQNDSTAVNLTLTPKDGFSGNVTLAPPANLPANVTMTFTDSAGVELPNGVVSVTASTTIMAAVNHAPTPVDGVLKLGPAVPAQNVTLTATAETGVATTANFSVAVAGTGLLAVNQDPNDPDRSTFNVQAVEVPVGTGLCLVNNKVENLRLHGSPHQAGGDTSALGECYDKFGGMNTTMDLLANVTPCDQADEDRMYDHNSGSNSGSIMIICQ